MTKTANTIYIVCDSQNYMQFAELPQNIQTCYKSMIALNKASGNMIG